MQEQQSNEITTIKQLDGVIKLLRSQGCNRINVHFRRNRFTMSLRKHGMSIGDKGETLRECVENILERVRYNEWHYLKSIIN